MRDLLSAILFLLSATAIEAKDDVDSQMKAAVFAGWDKLERIDESKKAIDVTWKRKYLEGPQKNNVTTGSSRYRRNGELESISVESDKTDVIVRNSRYDFFISRESNNNPWVARFVNLISNNQSDRQIPEGFFLARFVAPTSAIIAGAFTSQQRKWGSFKNDPKFHITKIVQMENGNTLVHYKYNLIAGEFECDSRRNYVILRGRSRDSDGQLSYDVSFERKMAPSAPDGNLFVESLTYEVISNPIDVAGKIQTEAIYSYPDLSKTNELSEESFRLSYYGLPEPEGVVWEKPRNYLSYWLVGGGALVVVLATLVLRYLRKRPKEIQP